MSERVSLQQGIELIVYHAVREACDDLRVNVEPITGKATDAILALCLPKWEADEREIAEQDAEIARLTDRLADIYAEAAQDSQRLKERIATLEAEAKTLREALELIALHEGDPTLEAAQMRSAAHAVLTPAPEKEPEP